ncbi:MAG: hypothetical protein LKG27_03605 [Clostridiaceae bacterium]|jgi:hypothetical protein|nr:hypothetical protein [Clostridiaceae bacterium]
MQVNAIDNRQTFTSIIPIKVYINGKQSVDPKHIQKATKQFINKVFTDSINQNMTPLTKHLAQCDPDFNPNEIAYANMYSKKRCIPSDFIRTIITDGKIYLATGKTADRLEKVGHNIGRSRRMAKDMYVKPEDTYEFSNAQDTYGAELKDIINNTRLRLTEGYNQYKNRIGKQICLSLNMLSNNATKPSKLKFNLNNVTYSYVPMSN